jgi:hypothetical protein
MRPRLYVYISATLSARGYACWHACAHVVREGAHARGVAGRREKLPWLLRLRQTEAQGGGGHVQPFLTLNHLTVPVTLAMFRYGCLRQGHMHAHEGTHDYS